MPADCRRASNHTVFSSTPSYVAMDQYEHTLPHPYVPVLEAVAGWRVKNKTRFSPCHLHCIRSFCRQKTSTGSVGRAFIHSYHRP
jgi:hypothetical protein